MQRVCKGLGQSRWGYEKGGPFLLNDCQDWRPLDRQKYQQLEQNAKKKQSKSTLAWTVWAFYKCVPCCLYIISRHTNDHPFAQLRNIHWCTNRTCMYISASECTQLYDNMPNQSRFDTTTHSVYYIDTYNDYFSFALSLEPPEWVGGSMSMSVTSRSALTWLPSVCVPDRKSVV